MLWLDWEAIVEPKDPVINSRTEPVGWVGWFGTLTHHLALHQRSNDPSHHPDTMDLQDERSAPVSNLVTKKWDNPAAISRPSILSTTGMSPHLHVHNARVYVRWREGLVTN